ncbi:MAG: flagellar hook protein FlgE [Gammaproteobacteria bacterium]|nr:flagellar hook protein FlgE [Gammaproteobacteria bacterium]
MSFNTALSGLNAAQADLSVTSNDIANVNTTGFKESRAEFGDIFATSSLGSSSTAIGSGVLLSKVAQQFNQGNLDFTSNSLDLAISGDGMFVMSPSLDSQEQIFTRSGALGVNSDGFVVNSSGQFLRVFPVNDDGTVSATSLSSTSPLNLPSASGSPTVTSQIEIGVNLPATADELDPALFNQDEPTTYTSSTSISIIDSLGESHVATFYYVKDNSVTDNEWAQFVAVDGELKDVVDGTVGTTSGAKYGTINFDDAGVYTGPITSFGIEELSANGSGLISHSTGAADQAIEIDYNSNSPTQFATGFAVSTLSHDGFGTGQLSGLDISDEGVIRANYTNGTSTALGKIALGRFDNAQGLRQEGNTAWTATIDSGDAIAGEAGSQSFGLIRSGALEASNVDLTAELVNLITAQRNFQANAKSIETSNTVTQAILQIR